MPGGGWMSRSSSDTAGRVLQPKFAGAKELTKGYTPIPFEVAPMVDSGKYQLALLLKSTPLGALEQLGRHGEVMPQKSTYFIPSSRRDGHQLAYMTSPRAWKTSP
jgi:hypothetical protein